MNTKRCLALEVDILGMPRSPEQSPMVETRQPKVEFDWEKHLKAEWEKVAFLDSELKSLIIEGPKGSVDVLKLVDATKVFCKDRGTNETDAGTRPSGEVDINKLDNLLDLACLMHEFGHVDQMIHKNFDQKICQLAIDANEVGDIEDFDARSMDKYSLQIKTMAKRVIEMFPELAGKIDVDQMSGYLDREELAGIVEMPVKIVERDATARALKWFREISEKTGIDFFKKFKIEKLAELDICQSSIQERMVEPDKFEETSMVEGMNKWLKTYHAETLTDTYDPAKTGKRIKPKLDKK